MTKIVGKVIYKHTFLHLGISAFPTLIFVLLLFNAIFKQSHLNAGTLILIYVFGTWSIVGIILWLRFFKWMIIDGDIISITYPLLFRRRVYKISEIDGVSSFTGGFYKNPFTFRYKPIDHDFSLYKTIHNDYFLIGDYNFSNYKEIISYINKNAIVKEEVEFLRGKHLYIFLSIFFALLIFLAYVSR
jgi:hypothetical protein